MKYKKGVYKSLALITQLGISMMVPIGCMVALGIWIDNQFHTAFVIPFMILGILAGGRNVYKMAMAVAKDEKEQPKEPLTEIREKDLEQGKDKENE